MLEHFCHNTVKTSIILSIAGPSSLANPQMHSIAVTPTLRQVLILAQDIRPPPTLLAIQAFLATQPLVARIGQVARFEKIWNNY